MWEPEGVEWYRTEFSRAIGALSERGVVFVVPAPLRTLRRQRPNERVDEVIPQCLTTSDNDIIMVGGTDRNGRLWSDSMLGTPECPVSVYAQGQSTQAYDLSEDKPVNRDGTCYAAAQVAGLAAYFLSHPDYRSYFKYRGNETHTGSTVGRRMKKLLMELAYQRVSNDMKLDWEAREEYDPRAVHERVDVIYNGIHGQQTG
ncbi:hypothetical protein VTK26DRAFT_4406 [Humicola hyalothermophila]